MAHKFNDISYMFRKAVNNPGNWSSYTAATLQQAVRHFNATLYWDTSDKDNDNSKSCWWIKFDSEAAEVHFILKYGE